MGCNIPQVEFSFPCVMEFIQGVRNGDPIVTSLRRASTILLGVTQNFTPAPEEITITLETQDFESLASQIESVSIMDEQKDVPWELIFQLVMWWLENRRKKQG